MSKIFISNLCSRIHSMFTTRDIIPLLPLSYLFRSVFTPFSLFSLFSLFIRSIIPLSISFIGIVFLFVVGIFHFISGFWFYRFNNLNNLLMSKDLSKLMFEAKFMQKSLSAFSILLSTS